MSDTISIITVTYNCLDEFKKTYSSIEKQSYFDYEFIVIDGGSKDGTLEFLKSCNRIDLLVSEPDDGIYDAMNKGIHKSSGDWLIFMNAGDCFYSKDSLLFSRKEIEECSNVDIIYTDVYLGNGIIKQQNHDFLFFVRNSICHQSMILNRSVFRDCLYDASYKLTADNQLLVRQIDKLSFRKASFIMSIYDLGGVSSNRKNKSNIWKEKVKYLCGSNIGFVKKVIYVSYASSIFIMMKLFFG